MGNESDELPDEDQYEYEDEYSNEDQVEKANVSNTCYQKQKSYKSTRGPQTATPAQIYIDKDKVTKNKK